MAIIMPYIIETNNKLDKYTEHDVLTKIKSFYFKDKPLSIALSSSLVDVGIISICFQKDI